MYSKFVIAGMYAIGHGVLFYHNVRLIAIPTENTRSFLNGPRAKASSTIERLKARRLRAQRKERLHWQGASYACLFTQVYFTHELSTWEPELFTELTTLRVSLFGYHVEQLRQALGKNPKECHEFNLSFVGPKVIGFQAFFGLSWVPICLVSLLPWYLTLSTFTTSHLLKLSRAWGMVKKLSKLFKALQALNASLSIASSSSQLKL